MADQPESFGARWSRRKAAQSTSEAPEPAAQRDDQPSMDTPPPPDLPPIEQLTAESDFTQFLQDGVPAALKKAALNKLWRSNPVLANLDGLNDYDLDYTNGATKTLMATAYEVGKGMAKRLTTDTTKTSDATPCQPEPPSVANSQEAGENDDQG